MVSGTPAIIAIKDNLPPRPKVNKPLGALETIASFAKDTNLRTLSTMLSMKRASEIKHS